MQPTPTCMRFSVGMEVELSHLEVFPMLEPRYGPQGSLWWLILLNGYFEHRSVVDVS